MTLDSSSCSVRQQEAKSRRSWNPLIRSPREKPLRRNPAVRPSPPANGRRPPAVTIRDVAERSGFSSATVSIVLNNAPLARYIPDTTKGKIQRAAAHLGYRPNLFARSLRGRRSHTVGVMVFDMTDPYCTLVLRGIENTLYQSSYLPILTDVHNERSRFERYLEMLLDRRIEGLVVLANWLFVDINVLADLEKNNIPTATVGRELKTDKISSVIVDNAAGARARSRASAFARPSQDRVHPRPAPAV